MSTDVNTEAVNPLIQKARWISAKLKTRGSKAPLPEESIFVAELSRRAWVQGDRTAQRLVNEIQVSHLEFQLSLSQV